MMNIEAIVKKHFDRWVTDTEFGNVEVHLRAALTELAAEYEQRITDLEDVLRSLAFSLSAGGYNADTVDSTVFEKKIRDGIDMLIAPLRERIRQLEALMVPGDSRQM